MRSSSPVSFVIHNPHPSRACSSSAAMVGAFGRSISLPLSPSRTNVVRHARSVSLPSSRTHPTLAHLAAQIAAVASWAANPLSVLPGIATIRDLQAAIDDIFILNEARAALCRSDLGGRLLDAFLALADALGSFLSAAVAVKHAAADAEAALRRSDEATLLSTAKSLRRQEKEILHLAAAVRHIAKHCSSAATSSSADDVESSIASLLLNAVLAMATAICAVFSSLAAAANAASAAAGELKACKKLGFARKSSHQQGIERAAFSKLRSMEERIEAAEEEGERLFRSFVRTRVSLLNLCSNQAF